jgi:hypothetical protein
VTDQPFITDDHYRAFGKIIARFAGLEMILEAALAAMLKMQPGLAPLVMTTLRYEQKRDLLRTLNSMADWPSETRDEFDRLIKNADSVNKTRRYVAHSMWKPGRKVGRIKPMAITAKGDVKMLGMHHNEKEYSATDLEAEAKRIADIAQRFRRFLDHHGLLAPYVETAQ